MSMTPRLRLLAASAATVTAASALAAAPPAAAATSAATVAAQAYARMTPAQRIGQLFMVGVPVSGASTTTRNVLNRYHVGNAILMGATSRGVTAVAATVSPVRTSTTQAGVSPYIAVDQEGGYVQHLKGSGFSTIPTALRQGTLASSTLRADWHTWAGQLRRAGLNLDLAPVADVVPRAVGTANQPIGRYYREYGYTTSTVSPAVTAVQRGIHDAGISSSLKHFPGLGRASGNTDTTSGVSDPTRRHDAYLAPFQTAVKAGAPMVMVSTCIYPNIDPHHIAAFSHVIATEMLRHDLGFTGVTISDDLLAKSVGGYSYAWRAVLALDAGVDLLLVTTTTPVSAMTSAIASRARSDSAFASVVKGAVMHVLQAKAAAGLIH